MDRSMFLLICGLALSVSVARTDNDSVGVNSPKEGFAFAQYNVRYGEALLLQCVTTKQVSKFSSVLRGVPESVVEFPFKAVPKIMYKRYFLYKQSFSQLFNVYSLYIFTALYDKDDRDFRCHTSDGEEYLTRVVVTGQGRKGLFLPILFSRPDYVIEENAQVSMFCLRPDQQVFKRFVHYRNLNGPKTQIKEGENGFKIVDNREMNYTELQFAMSSESKIGFYECHAGTKVTLAKVSMKCKVHDATMKRISFRQGETGNLRVKWSGDLAQQSILKAWYKIAEHADLSSLQHAASLELRAARFGTNFYAVSDARYSIKDDGTLVIRNVRPKDKGYYKFRLTCGRYGQIDLILKVNVI